MIIDLFAMLFLVTFLALAWTFLGYPLVMFVVAQIAPCPIQRDPTLTPSLTLLIPAYNEADVIRAKLENSVSLNYPPEKLQILVVDDGSDDKTANIVSEFESRGVTLLRQPIRSGKMAAVNRGFSEAIGEIVVLSDASPSYERDSLHKLVGPFADSTVGVVVGTLAVWDAKNAVAKSAGLYWKYEAALRKWESRTGSTVAVHGNMFAIRRNLYSPLRPTTINDEFSIAMEVMRQRYRVVYEPAAISYDMVSATMGDEFKRRARINAGRYQALLSTGYLKGPTLDLTFRLFSHKLLRPLTPLFMISMLFANLLVALVGSTSDYHLGLLQGLWQLLLVGQITFYAIAGLGMVAEKQGFHNRILNVPYFFVSSNFAALMGLWRWLRDKQRVTWQKRAGDNP
jgi:cellulose synthase/poly-beta-1,6-N-acetylglucosamine synthase-like glycosyltransferase